MNGSLGVEHNVKVGKFETKYSRIGPVKNLKLLSRFD